MSQVEVNSANIPDYLSTDKVLKTIKEKETQQYNLKRKAYFIFKRISDVIISLIGIIALAPVTIFVKICYLLTGDTKSIFYVQKRIGKNGKVFKIYKFRSMVLNSEKLLDELLKKGEYRKEWYEKQKLSDDPRITKIGNILRKSYLDEMPQFINVIKGDMSFIGPRPLVEGELDAHHGCHEIYESVRPGISGWWACNNSNTIGYDERLELEYYYCINCNVKLDIKCIFRTIKKIL